MFASIYFRDFKDALKICGIFPNTEILRGYAYNLRMTFF